MSSNNYSLLVYNEIPETTRFFLIPNFKINPAMHNWMSEAHNKFINSDDTNDGMNFLSTALCKDAEGAHPDFEEFAGMFLKYEVLPDALLKNGRTIQTIYYSGFYL